MSARKASKMDRQMVERLQAKKTEAAGMIGCYLRLPGTKGVGLITDTDVAHGGGERDNFVILLDVVYFDENDLLTTWEDLIVGSGLLIFSVDEPDSEEARRARAEFADRLALFAERLQIFLAGPP